VLGVFVCVQSWAQGITGKDEPLEEHDVADFPEKNLLVVLTTDKGLCGGVNSILSRMTRQLAARMTAQNKTFEVIVAGEKGRSQLRRVFQNQIRTALTDRVAPYNFGLASAIAREVLAAEADAVHILYNKFKSAIVYIPSIKTIKAGPLLNHNDPFYYKYEVEPELDPETLSNFFEYTLATQIFHSLMENATSEQSSRMNAMENASQNASDMINKLTLRYNRARQARITTELIEIISGAAALKG
jgi:F-type H+-transporting ATPase subunit gamma